MTVVNFDFADPAGVPVKGYVSLVPTRRVTVGDEVRLPTALRVRLEAGEASVELMPSTTQWVWRVAELVPGGITRYVAVPDSELAVEYADLESVDPSSLDVSSASVPAWEIATRTTQDMLDKVDKIDGKVERAEGAATAAQQAVDGFGLTVGSVTTGGPGTDAAVDITKTGAKYTANFTIPRGDKGEQASVEHDATLMGDGTGDNPLGMIDGNFINAIPLSGDDADANNLTQNRIYKIDRNWKNMPSGLRIVGGDLLDATYGKAYIQCILAYTDGKNASIFIRQGWTKSGLANAKWDRLVKESEYNDLVNRVATLEAKLNDFAAIQTRLQALETRVESLENNR